MPERARLWAIADPDAAKVREVARQFEIPAERCFDSAEALLAELRLADALVLCTRTGSMCPRPFLPSARAMTFSWKSPSPRPGPVQRDSGGSQRNRPEGGSLSCSALRSLLPEDQEVLDPGSWGS